MDMKDIELTQEQNKKATKTDWFRNNVRSDLNSLLAQITKQNGLFEKLIKKIDLLSDEVARFRSDSRKT